jgi:hypothetical protein
MADTKTLQTRIALKHDTWANWHDETKEGQGANFVLLKGEIGICEIPSGNSAATTAPTVLFKVGDGTTPFKSLKWASALAADVYSWAKASDVVLEGKGLKFVGGNADGSDKIVNIPYVTETEVKAITDPLTTRISNIEAKFTGDTSVDSQISALDGRLDVIEGEGAGSIKKAEADAKAYTDGKDTAMNTRVSALETASATHALKTEVEAVDAKFADYKTAETQKAIDDEQDRRIKAIEDDYVVAADIADFETKANVKKVADDLAAYVESNNAAVADRYTKAEADGKFALIADAYDDEEVRGLISANADAIAAEKTRAEGIEGGLRADVDAIKGDYLKSSDKTDLQNQINIIMNNPDTENVINSISEFTQYITDHGEIAEGFRTDIDANTKAIEDHEALAAQTYETKEDATAKYDEVKAEIAAIPQADWAQNDEIAADYVKNRTHYDSIEVVELNATVNVGAYVSSENTEDLFDTLLKAVDLSDIVVTLNDGLTGVYTVGEKVSDYSDEYTRTRTVDFELIDSTGNKARRFALRCCESEWYGKSVYVWDNNAPDGNVTGGATITGSVKTGEVHQLDEKFIPDTIARTADVAAMDEAYKAAIDAEVARANGAYDATGSAAAAQAAAEATAADALASAKSELEGKITAAQTAAEGYADGLGTAMNLRVEALEAIDHSHTFVESELNLIKSGDVAKWNATEQNAKNYADGLDTAMDGRVAGLETEIVKKANDADLAAIAKTGSTDDLVAGSQVWIFDCGTSMN